MASFVDQAAANYGQIQMPNLAGNYAQGVNQGVDIAQRQAQIQMQQQELQLKRQQLEAQKDQHEYQLLESIRSAKEDPETQKALGQEYIDVRAARNKPVNESLVKLMNKNTDIGKATDFLVTASRADPNEVQYVDQDTLQPIPKSVPGGAIIPTRQWATQMLEKFHGGTVSSALQLAKQINDPYVKSQMAQAAFGRGVLAQGLNPSIAQELWRNAQTGDPQAMKAFADYTSQGKAAQSVVQGQERVDISQQRADTQEKNVDSLVSTREQKLAQFRQQMQISFARLGLQKQRVALSAHDRIDNDKDLTNYTSAITGANRAVQLLNNPGMTWQQLRETNVDIAQLMQIKPSAVVPVYREQGINPRTWSQDLAKAQTYFSDKSEGQVPEAMKLQMRDVLTRIGKVAASAHDLKLQTRVGSVQSSGVWNTRDAEMEFDNRKFSDKPYLEPTQAAKAKPYQGMAQQVTGAPSNTPNGVQAGGSALKAPSDAFINIMKQKIPNDTVRNTWLKSHGFQPPGGQ